MTRDEFLKSLVVAAIPAVEPLSAMRMRRRWIARTSSPIGSALEAYGRDVEREVRVEIDKLYGSTVEAESLRECYPTVRLTEIDDVHLGISIEGPGAIVGVGDAVVVVEWGVLTRLDNRFHFEDLQGLPRRCWALYLPP